MKTYLIISFLVVNFYQPCQFQPLTPSKSYDLTIGEGDYAKPGQFPFAVVMAEVAPAYTTYLCTGAIIHESWVLMAAHCFIQYRPSMIFAGSTYWWDGIRYNITKWFTHPEYANAAQVNDVAVAKIDGIFKFDQFIAPIKIGELKANEAISIVGSATSENIKYDSVTIIFSYDECVMLMPFYANISLVPGSICSINAGGNNFDFTNGAPLIQNGILVGIFSHFINNFGIEGNASYYFDWIKQIIYENP